MRLLLVLSLALAGCAAKKPAAKHAGSPGASERDESRRPDHDKSEKSDKSDKDADDPDRDPMKSDPCEGGE